MKKARTVSVIVFIVVMGLVYAVLANSHIDIFPGTVCTRGYQVGASCGIEFISLLDHNRAITSYSSEAFNVFGWIVFVIVMLAVPGSSAFLADRLMKRKRK
jgi:hypothetical protein